MAGNGHIVSDDDIILNFGVGTNSTARPNCATVDIGKVPNFCIIPNNSIFYECGISFKIF
jgi:hypothetical protein